MKVFRIVFAACDDATIKKLHVVANLFQEQSKNYAVRFDAWDGTKADFVIANVDDAYGIKVARLASHRKMKLIMLAKNKDVIPNDLEKHIDSGFITYGMPIATIFRQFSGSLKDFQEKVSPVNDPLKDVSNILFQQVLDAKNFLFMSTADHVVCFHIGRGMCFAESQKVLESMQNNIQQRSAVTISEHKPEHFSASASTSAENFFFHAFLNMPSLPKLPAPAVRLKVWPNIHYREDPTAITMLSSQVMDRTLTVSDFTGKNEAIGKAYLCAAAVAQLLEYHQYNVPSDTKTLAKNENPTIIKKLSRWLGLAS